MKIINVCPDVERIFIDEFKSHLYEDVNFAKIYPNFGNVRVSGVHPFAFLMDQEINGTSIPVGLFPSLTIVNDTEMENPDTMMAIQLKDDILIKGSDITEIENNRSMYKISDEDLRSIKDLIGTSGPLHSVGVDSYLRASMACEVWSENMDVKNALYDISRNFLLGSIRFTIQESFGIIIKKDSIRGERSGNYNFDFGQILYGGMLRWDADMCVSQYVIPEDQVEIKSIHHTYQEVGDKNV